MSNTFKHGSFFLASPSRAITAAPGAPREWAVAPHLWILILFSPSSTTFCSRIFIPYIFIYRWIWVLVQSQRRHSARMRPGQLHTEIMLEDWTQWNNSQNTVIQSSESPTSRGGWLSSLDLNSSMKLREPRTVHYRPRSQMKRFVGGKSHAWPQIPIPPLTP